MKLFVSNVTYSAVENDLKDAFVQRGYIPAKITICSDQETGKSKGFAFLEVDDRLGADAIAEMDGAEVLGRRINVQAAREKARR